VLVGSHLYTLEISEGPDELTYSCLVNSNLYTCLLNQKIE